MVACSADEVREREPSDLLAGLVVRWPLERCALVRDVLWRPSLETEDEDEVLVGLLKLSIVVATSGMSVTMSVVVFLSSCKRVDTVSTAA